MAFLIYRHKGTTFTSWLQKPKGHKGWILLAFSVSLLPLPAFIFGWHTLDSGLIISLWILTFLINPPLEEGYWRGVMMEITQHWPAWLSIIYTSVFFTASHPLMWGVFSIANQSPVTWAAVFLMGLAWGTYFYKTKSLRWVIVAHIIVDILNLCVPVFLNKFTGM
nr:CPBP family intramembrane glutamic endopeptidase [Evansella tamaricis]